MMERVLPDRELQIGWLRAFVAVIDAGSITAAGPLVHRSQSAVSTQLRKLEDAVGQPVLRRGPRHLELTPAGAELLGHARRLLAVHAEALGALRGTELTGRLRVGVPDDYAVAYLAPVLRRYAGLHARVQITLDCEQSTALIPRIGRGELDLALVSRDRPSRGTLLFAEPLVWVAAPRHEAWLRDPLPLAAYEPGSLARRDALGALGRHGRAHRVVYNSSSLAGQLAAVDSGLAVAVLTRCSVPPGLLILGERHGLPTLPSMDVAVLRSRSAQTPAAEAFERLMIDTLARPA